MPHIYPPSAPTISGDIISISRFLQSPALVQRRLREITTQRFIADVILSGRYEASGGSLLYEQTESIYTAKAPEAIAPGAEYPRTAAAPGPAALAAITKWGQEVPITDENIKRYGRRSQDVSFLKIANYLIRQVDSVALAAIAAAVTQTTTAIAAWNTPATADPLLDLMLAAAAIRANDQGYDPDYAVMTDVSFARMVANSKIIAGLTREKDISPTAAGIRAAQEVAGVTPLPTNNLPVASTVFVLDSAMLGGLGYERLESPEYQGDPANGVETSSRRDPLGNDQWLVRGRRPVVPIVQEPNAAYKITSV